MTAAENGALHRHAADLQTLINPFHERSSMTIQTAARKGIADSAKKCPRRENKVVFLETAVYNTFTRREREGNEGGCMGQTTGRRKRNKILPFIIFAAVILVLSLCMGLAFRYKPVKDRYDQQKYFHNESNADVALVINNEIAEGHGVLVDGAAYFTYEQVRQYLNDRFYWEESRGQMLYAKPDGVAVHDETNGILLKDDTVYLSMDLIRLYTPMASCEVYDSPARVVIDNANETYTVADVKKDQAVRYRGGVKSPILTDVEEGTPLRVLEEGDNWSQVRTEDGYIGYIQKKFLENRREESVSTPSRNDGYASLTKDYPINLTWHQVMSYGENDEISTRLLNAKGVNVLSPTWFHLQGQEGDIASIASTAYVAYAHEQGIQVWGMVDNFTETVDTGAVLSDPVSRQTLIDNLIHVATDYSLDGLNIDFEELKAEEGPAFIQFIRELSLRCHSNGLVLSVDNHVPYDYNSFYQPEEQAAFADYIILMGYDEHLNEETGLGSVASIEFVTSGIDRMLKMVPCEKLINAVPFYTRIWKEVPKTEAEIAAEGSGSSEGEYNPYKLNWQSVGMTKAEETLASLGVQPSWDETVKQYYAEYTEGDTQCKVWLEEERSIEEKLKVMQEKQVAGVASWKLGLEKAAIWEVISRYYSMQ